MTCLSVEEKSIKHQELNASALSIWLTCYPKHHLPTLPIAEHEQPPALSILSRSKDS